MRYGTHRQEMLRTEFRVNAIRLLIQIEFIALIIFIKSNSTEDRFRTKYYGFMRYQILSSIANSNYVGN